jgi:hypothetical protein
VSLHAPRERHRHGAGAAPSIEWQSVEWLRRLGASPAIQLSTAIRDLQITTQAKGQSTWVQACCKYVSIGNEKRLHHSGTLPLDDAAAVRLPGRQRYVPVGCSAQPARQAGPSGRQAAGGPRRGYPRGQAIRARGFAGGDRVSRDQQVQLHGTTSNTSRQAGQRWGDRAAGGRSAERHSVVIFYCWHSRAGQNAWTVYLRGRRVPRTDTS